MELNEFIKEIFINIIDGVKASQEYAIKNNARVAPSSTSSHTTGGNKMNITFGTSTHEVEFEIILGKTVTSKNKVGIGVLLSGIGAGGNNEKGIENIVNSKIKFSIPFVFPIDESKF